MSLQVVGHQTEGYRIETEVYQGPLDLLLELIEKAELDITRLALAQVTDQYLAYMRRLQIENPGEVSAFLVIASRLVQIKSQALLPKQPVEPGAEEEEDPADALARQLILYKKFKEISQWLQEREQENLRTYLRVAPPPKYHVQPKLDLTGVTLRDLVQAARDVLRTAPTLPALNSVVQLPRITIREKISSILQDLKELGKTTFNEILAKRNSKVEIVVTFLALLELVKRHIITAQQNSLFGEIDLHSEGNLEQASDIEIEFEE